MDGPAVASGGGLEIGSGYVAVTVQIDEALQRLGVLKQAMADVTSMPMNIGGGGGSAFGGHAPMPAGGNPMGWQGLPSPSMPTAQQPAGVHGHQGIPTPPHAGHSHQQPAGGHEAGGEEGGERSIWESHNMHQFIHHLLERIGIRTLPIMAAAAIGQVATGYAEANYIRGHAEDITMPLYQYGSGLGLYNNAGMQQIGAGIVEHTARKAEWEAVRRIPFVGEVAASLGGEWQIFRHEQAIEGLKREGEETRMVGETGERAAMLEAQASGDPVEVAKTQHEQEMKKLTGNRAQLMVEKEAAGKELDKARAEAASYMYVHGETGGTYKVRAHPEADKDVSEAQAKVDRVTKNLEELGNQINRSETAFQKLNATVERSQAALARGTAAGSESADIMSEAGFSRNPFEARAEAAGKTDQAALHTAYNEWAATPTEANLEKLKAAYATQARNQKVIGREQEMDEQKIKLQVEAAGLRGGMSDYGAQQLEYQAQLAGMGQNDPQRAVVAANMRASQQRAAYEGDFSNFQAGNSAEQATLRGNRQFNEAALQDIAAGTANQVLQLDPNGPRYQQRREALYGLGQAQTAAAVTEQQFNIKQNVASFGAREQAANYQAGYMTNAAQATMDVQRAQHEAAMANTPEERAAAISASRAELQSHAHLLTDQRGGNQAIMMRGSEALGSVSARGVDITEHLKDIREAQKIYGKGAEAGGLEKVAEDANKIDTKTLNAAIAKFNQIMSKWETNAQKWGSPPGV